MLKTIAAAFVALAMSAHAADAPPPAAPSEDSPAVLRKTVEMQDAEITFLQEQGEGLKAQIAAYERILAQPAIKAKKELDAEVAKTKPPATTPPAKK